MYTLENFYGPNAGYVLELYDRYKQDPALVDEATRAIFATWTPEQVPQQLPEGQPAAELTVPRLPHPLPAPALAPAFGERGHRGAHLNPWGSPPGGNQPFL